MDRGALSGQLEMWGPILVGGEETRFLQEEGVDQEGLTSRSLSMMKQP